MIQAVAKPHIADYHSEKSEPGRPLERRQEFPGSHWPPRSIFLVHTPARRE